MVMEEKRKVSEAAQRLSIKLSTAKFIFRSFKRHGRIFKKKRGADVKGEKILQNLQNAQI